MSDIKWTIDDQPFVTLPTHQLPMISAGSALLVSGPDGFVRSDQPQGLLAGDHRALSKFVVTINGEEPTCTGALERSRGEVSFSYVFPGGAATLDRSLLANASSANCLQNAFTFMVEQPVEVEVTLDADFITAMEMRNPADVDPPPVERNDGIHLWRLHRTVRFSADGEVIENGRWSGPISAEHPQLDIAIITSSGEDPWFSSPIPTALAPAASPWLKQSSADINALSMQDGILGAGMPWFYTPFARDTCIALLLMGSNAPKTSAINSLRILGAHIGIKHFEKTGEEPGRIPHEIRLLNVASTDIYKGSANYFSIDATPLWLLAVGAMAQAGHLDDDLDDLLPAVEAATDWMLNALDVGKGLVWYHRSGSVGLVNQGWKDSADAIVDGRGDNISGPIALIEVQCYVERALQTAISLSGDEALCLRLTEASETLRERINRDFFFEIDGATFVGMGLDSDGNVIDAPSSNPGHGLWTQSFDAATAAIVRKQIFKTELWCDYGVRTLAADSPAFSLTHASSYHLGPVWPHETAIISRGLVHYGMVEDAARCDAANQASFDASTTGRLPEAHTGTVDENGNLVLIPRSCRIQLWAAAAGFAAHRNQTDDTSPF